MFRVVFVSISITFMSIFATLTFAESKNITLQNGLNGYDGCEDSFVESIGKKNDTVPRGDEDFLKIAEWFSWNFSFARVALIFDLPEDLSGATIEQAKLSLRIQDFSRVGKIMTAFRLTQSWSEAELVWDYPSNDVSWEVPFDVPQSPLEVTDSMHPGGMISLEDTVRIPDGGMGNWEDYDITAIVQKIANGEENYGFLLKADDMMGLTEKKYYSSEYSDLTLSPKLELTYEPTSNPIADGVNKIKSTIITKSESSNKIVFNVSDNSNYEIVLSTLSGRKISSFSGLGNRSFSIDKAKLNSACYLLTLKRDGYASLTERIMIVK